MNRPGAFTYLIGNPISLIGLWLLTAFLAYEWYSVQGPVILPIITGIAGLSAVNAYQRIDKYRLWKREWEAMNGVMTTGSLTGDLMQSTAFKVVVGGAIWCAGAYGALTLGSQPGMQVVSALFWIGTLIMIGGNVYRRAQRRKAAMPKPQAVRDVAVTQCVRAPTQSPSVQQAFASLPQYCLPLFERPEQKGGPLTR